jgi:ribonucleoside-diphosphate reductase alpha chain
MGKVRLHCVYLSAVNIVVLAKEEELENLCDLAVRGLEELIDYQQYPVVEAAKRSTLARRSLRYRIHRTCTLPCKE